ncbi:MAG: hypothetical protein RLZZ70_408 [Candidatus Parcubacteria bacterium]
MVDVPSSSFIPKRNAQQATRRNRGHNFFLLAIISYACFIAAPTASAAVFVYNIYVERQFAEAVVSLESAISEFGEADMKRVIEFDARLRNAEELVENHVSINKVLAHLETNTIDLVSFTTLTFTRTPEGGVKVEGSALADSLDSAYFQRTVYGRESVVGDGLIADVSFNPGEDEAKLVEFVGTYTYAPSDILFASTAPVATTENVTPAVDSTESDDVDATASSTEATDSDTVESESNS